MAYKIIGFVKVQTNIKVGSNYVGTKLKFKNSDKIYESDSNGNVEVPSLLEKHIVDSMFKDLPVSQFGKLDGTNVRLTLNGKILSFTETNPLFIAGQYFEIPPTAIDIGYLGSVNSILYVYVQLKLGIPKYTISLIELPETQTLMFIGTIKTNQNGDINYSLITKVSRFDEYRVGLNPIGSGIPVSSGNPTTDGNINW